MKIFKTGFMGASLDDVTVWCYERSEGAKDIFVPYAGSGKDIASARYSSRAVAKSDNWREDKIK